MWAYLKRFAVFYGALAVFSLGMTAGYYLRDADFRVVQKREVTQIEAVCAAAVLSGRVSSITECVKATKIFRRHRERGKEE